MTGRSALRAGTSIVAAMLLAACAGASEDVGGASKPASSGTCEERAHARPMCLGAAESDCASTRNECDATCGSRLVLPGNSNKEPALRGDIEGQGCRELCRQAERACFAAAAVRCPTLCDGAEVAATFDRAAAERAVARELDDLHDAAAHADETRYLGHFAWRAVFLGTDAKERWDLPAFTAFVHPYFSKGKGWTYHVERRAISFAPPGDVAWFDEDLRGERVGPTRGSGVLLREGGRWLVAQYNLAFTIPNERFDELHALLDAPPHVDLRTRHEQAYREATEALAHGDAVHAGELLAALVDEAKTRPADDLEFRIDDELTWVRWSAGDGEGARAEVEQAKTALDHATLPPDRATRLRLHERWDRAYLAMDQARREKGPGRARWMADADRARADYEAIAKPANDRDGMAVLAAFFAWARGDGRAAGAEAKKVDAAQEDDLQDLYVVALALDAAGDHDGAAKVRDRVCKGKESLMKPIVARAMQAEGHACP